MGGLAENLGLEGATPAPSLVEQLGLEGTDTPSMPSFLNYEVPEAPAPKGQPAPPEMKGDLPDDARVLERGIAAEAPPTALEAFARSLRNPFNLSDEIAKGTSKAADVYTGHQQTPRTVGRGIDAPIDTRSDAQIAADEEKLAQAKADLAHPYATMAGKGTTEAALIALASALGGASAAPAATMTGRALQTAKIAAPVGALSGYGSSEAKTLGGQAIDTAIGAGTAALAGPILGEVTHQALRLPQLPTSIRSGVNKAANERAAKAVESEQGSELAQFARQIANPTSEEGIAARAQARAGASPEALAEHAANLEKNVTQISTAADTIQAKETIAKKAKLAGLMMKDDQQDPLPAVLDTDQLIKDMGDEVNSWKSQMVQGHPDNNFVLRIQRSIKQYEKSAPTAKSADPYDLAAQRFALADQVKREMQQAISKVNRSSPVIESMNAAEQQLRSHLENPAMWGPSTGAMQQARNKAWTEFLALETKDIAPSKTFLTDVYGNPSQREAAYRAMPTGSERDLQAIAKSAGTSPGSSAMQPEEWKLRQWGTRSANLGQALTEHPVAPDAALTALAKSQSEAAGNISKTLDQRIAEKQAADRLQKVLETRAPQPGVIEKAANLIPAHYLEGGGLVGMATGHEGLGAGAAAIGAGAQGVKGFFQTSTPEALATRATELANLEAQPLSNKAAQAALTKLRAVPTPTGPIGGLASKASGAFAARDVAQETPGQFSGDQMSQALKVWAQKNTDSGEGNTQGQGLTEAVKYTLEKNPQALGSYLIQLRDSKDLSKELLRLQGDLKWVKDVLPHLHNLVK